MGHWLDTAVFYEIYPQSFLDTNGDGIGDFQGIIEKLDYIKTLGCNALWLNPCFLSPFGDAGYDVADYRTAAPRYGTNADLLRLFEQAHKRGMRVLLDLVPGHTSVEHPWFQESQKPERNAYSDRYIWTDGIWADTEGRGCLRGLSQRDGACVVNFFSMQPALNYGYAVRRYAWQQAPDAPAPTATREAMKEVMRFWLKAGCDGFRVDMAGSLIKDDPDGEANVALWREFRAFLDAEFPEAVLISEWGEPDKALRGGFHMDFLLHFGPSHYNDLFRCEEPYFSKRGKGTAKQFVETYKENRRKAGKEGLICIPSGNHDMDRLARTLSQEEMKLAFAFLLSMPGAPFLYYGDEIGMRYVENLVSVEGGYGRTGARSPMQWNNGVNAGFSAASPERLYIPIDPEEGRPTVQAQQAMPDSLWNTVQKLLTVRRENEALQNNADIVFLQAEYPLAYERIGTNSSVLVIINPAEREVVFTAPKEFSAFLPEADTAFPEILFLLGQAPTRKGDSLVLAPCSAVFFRNA